MSDLVGRTLGPYRITAEIGRGGMANVYRAVQPSIGREVAIKVLPAHFLQDQTFLERFTREVQIIARLQHPRILPVYDFGEQDGLPYIVMAYMPGGTLAEHIRSSGGLPLDEVARLVGQIAEGLSFAHEKGVIHRDFKPSNVLLDEKGNVHLADFGIAKATEATAHLTGSGIVGTPAYMAPEMSRPGGVTPLVDVYALGVALYEMLTGQHPYRADTPVGVLMAHGIEPIPDARTSRPDLPEAVQRAIERAMAKNPAQRYQSASELAADLGVAISGMRRPQTQPVPSNAPAMGMVKARALPRMPMPRPAPAHRVPVWVWICGVLVAVAVMILSGTLIVRGIFAGNKGGGAPVLVAQATATPTSTPSPTAPPITPTTTFSPLPVEVADLFNSNANGWPLGASSDAFGSVTWSMSNGKYRWEFTAIDAMLRHAYPDVSAVTDFNLKVEGQRVQSTAEAAYGLAFRITDAGNYYFFAVSDMYQMYALFRWNGAELVTLIDWTYSYLIQPDGINKLMVVGEGSHFTLYISDQVVDEATDSELPRGHVGLSATMFYANSQAIIEFDNFELRSP